MISHVIVILILVQEEAGVQKPIYYINKILQAIKTMYFEIEKMVFAHITLMGQLWLHFQVHSMVILGDQPLKSIL